jgi:hypothetical protein
MIIIKFTQSLSLPQSRLIQPTSMNPHGAGITERNQ